MTSELILLFFFHIAYSEQTDRHDNTDGGTHGPTSKSTNPPTYLKDSEEYKFNMWLTLVLCVSSVILFFTAWKLFKMCCASRLNTNQEQRKLEKQLQSHLEITRSNETTINSLTTQLHLKNVELESKNKIISQLSDEVQTTRRGNNNPLVDRASYTADGEVRVISEAGQMNNSISYNPFADNRPRASSLGAPRRLNSQSTVTGGWVDFSKADDFGDFDEPGNTKGRPSVVVRTPGRESRFSSGSVRALGSIDANYQPGAMRQSSW